MIDRTVTDQDAWIRYPQYRWVFDRLELCRRLGYTCGPAGLPLPPGKWFAKPQINLRGMGLGARLVQRAADVPPGHIWMPFFEGRHLSVDYERRNAGWCPRHGMIIQGIYHNGRPILWSRIGITPPPLPEIFDEIVDVEDLNVEFIDGNVIEAHLRRNPDFEGRDDIATIVPIWSDYVRDTDDTDGFADCSRLGFVVLPDFIGPN